MLLLIYFTILFLFFLSRKNSTPSLLLISIYLFSLSCGLIMGFNYEIDSLIKLFNLFFLIVILSLFILPWHKIYFSSSISVFKEKRFHTLTIYLFVINGIAFFVLLIACYYAFTTITDYSSFKNSSDNTGFYREIPLNHTLHLLAIYLNPTSYFLIPIHFYYLVKKKYLFAFISLILSFNSILDGIAVFSRSSFVLYFFIYFFNLSFFLRKMDIRIQKIVKLSTFAVLGIAISFFLIISNNRFAGYLTYGNAQYSDSKIQNPVVYSLLDYLSQWYKNSNEVMSRYKFETLNGELTLQPVIQMANTIGIISYSSGAIDKYIKSNWGETWDRFVGLTAYLLIDFGYLGTFLFALLYSCLLKKLTPKNGKILMHKYLMLGTIFILPAMGIFSSMFNSISYHLLILYSIFVYLFLTIKEIKIHKE